MAGAAALHVRWRPKTPTTDAAPGTLAISAQLRRSCRPVWANDALDHARDSRAAGCPDEEWEQDATMKATLHERDADHDELLRRVQVQPDDVADQRRPQALECLRRDRSVPGIQPYLVQNLGIHWTPSGPATDPGLVDDRGRRVNSPESDRVAFQCIETYWRSALCAKLTTTGLTTFAVYLPNPPANRSLAQRTLLTSCESYLFGHDDVVDDFGDLLCGQCDMHRPEIDDQTEHSDRDHVPPQREHRILQRAEVTQVDDQPDADQVDRQPLRRPPVQHRLDRVEPEHPVHDEDHVTDEDRHAELPVGGPARPKNQQVRDDERSEERRVGKEC